jgi:hypothetical protein
MRAFILTFLLIFLLAPSCNSSKNSLHKISVANEIGKERVVNLSEIATEVKYVYFDTTGNSLLGQISAPVYENGYFYLADIQSGVFKIFDKEGKFVGNIGSKGRGPGEYLRAAGSLISTDSKTGNLYIFADTRIIEFSPTGKFIREILLPVNKDKSFRVVMAKRYNNGFVMNIVNISNQKNDLLFTDDSGKVTGKFPEGFDIVKTEPDPSALIKSNSILRYIVKSGEDLNIYNNSNDTVFRYSEGDKKNAVYVQDFGKYRLPADCTDPIQMLNYIQLIGFKTIDSENYIFYTYNFGNNLPNELAPKWVRGLYNKKSGELQLLKRPDTENSGFKNDLDGKYSFWPEYCNSNNYLIMGIPAKEENGNSGVMIVKFKSDK